VKNSETEIPAGEPHLDAEGSWSLAGFASGVLASAAFGSVPFGLRRLGRRGFRLTLDLL